MHWALQPVAAVVVGANPMDPLRWARQPVAVVVVGANPMDPLR